MKPLPDRLYPGSVPPADAGFLTLAGISKRYRRAAEPPLLALEDVSFTLAQRAIGVLLGPSGCGKSTLLRMVAGLDQPTAGTIELGGERIEDAGRDRGMVFQSYTSFPWLTVQQNVEYGLRLNGESLALQEGTAEYFIERVGLAKFRNVYPDTLSGGMRQRVALARALSTYPRLLLMDEPFGALDAETRWQMQELLLEVVTKERMTVLMVTHDIDEALFLGDQIDFLSRHPGRVRQIFEPTFKAGARIARKEALYDQPGYRQLEREVMGLMRDEGSRSA